MHLYTVFRKALVLLWYYKEGSKSTFRKKKQVEGVKKEDGVDRTQIGEKVEGTQVGSKRLGKW